MEGKKLVYGVCLNFSDVLAVYMNDSQSDNLKMATVDSFMLAHTVFLSAMWLVFINLGILFALYRHKFIYQFLHVLFSSIVVILTFCLSWSLLNPTLSFRYLPATIHLRMGVAMLIGCAFLTIFGTVLLVMKLTNKSPFVIYWLRKSHLVAGYGITYLAKINAFYFLYYKQYTTFFCFMPLEFIFTFAIIFIKFSRNTLEQTIDNDARLELVKPIHSIKEVSRNFSDFSIFGNLIYNLEPLKYNHPCGYQIVDSVKGKDIDRYIYGMYRSEKLPNVPAISHSERSFDLVGPPIARIQIKPCYKNFHSNTEFSLQSIETISEKGDVYELGFVPRFFSKFNFRGYEDVRQLGRYRSITIGSCTRLYTAANFLNAANKTLMATLLPKYTQGIKVSISEQSGNIEMNSDRAFLENHQEECLPVLLKYYSTGKLTPQLLKLKESDTVTISYEKGFGLQLADIPSGRLILVSGGTGMISFYDLIDLLYKTQLINERSSATPTLMTQNPILQTKCFERFTFLMIGAFQYSEDIHQLIMQQLIHLSRAKWFKCILKIKNSDCMQMNSKSNIIMTSQGFEQILQRQIRNPFEKVIICGPPTMNEGLTQLMCKEAVPNNKWMIF